ncbi:hypothetical protein KC338_g2244 [Hortaea werneckii]|nr:hypothetical protein KC338_g2244 [Hortaea werneckii]
MPSYLESLRGRHAIEGHFKSLNEMELIKRRVDDARAEKTRVFDKSDDDDDNGDDADEDVEDIMEQIDAKKAGIRHKKMLKENAAAQTEGLEGLTRAVSDDLHRLPSDTQSQADQKISEARRAALVFLSETGFFGKHGEADDLTAEARYSEMALRTQKDFGAAGQRIGSLEISNADPLSGLTKSLERISRLEEERSALESEVHSLRIADNNKAESLKAAEKRCAQLEQSVEHSRRSEQMLAARSSQDLRAILEIFLPMVRTWDDENSNPDDESSKNITEGIRQVRSMAIKIEPHNAVAESAITWDLAILPADLLDPFTLDGHGPVRLWLHICGCSEDAATAMGLIEIITEALAARQEFDSDAPRFVFVAARMMVAHTKSAFQGEFHSRFSLRLAAMRAIELCLRFAIPPSAPEIRKVFEEISFFVPDETRKAYSPLGALWRWLNDNIVGNKARPLIDYLATIEVSTHLNETEGPKRILIPQKSGIIVLDRDKKTVSDYNWDDISWTFDCTSDDGTAYDVISFDRPRRPERKTPPFRVRSTLETMKWVPKHMAPAVENARLRRVNDPHTWDFLDFLDS